jgi:RecB family exonuclease
MPLSYSQLSTYRRCPKQYDYAFVKKIGRQISAGESFGSSIHNTLKRFGELEMKLAAPTTLKRGQLSLLVEDASHDVPTELTLTTLLTMWRQCFIAEGYANRAAMDQKLLQGEKVLMYFFRWWENTPREVAAIEKSFKLVVDAKKDLVLTGRFDRVERTDGGLHIIDFKSTNPREPKSLTIDLQLSIYALAAAQLWKEPVEKLSLLCLTEDGAVEQSTTRSINELQDAMTSIKILAERIASGDLAATPSISVCRNCPYRDICPARAV